ncbi:probable glutamate receptor isoform X2 [Scylla paramamosain]|uniref:probable glutamate receptor isoform X2 n=1 Tax=Scylla paramamosain TaxID=85552 RepID=UPI0030827C52
MAGGWGAAGFLLLSFWVFESSGQNVTSQMVVDYVQFYKHRDVYVLEPDEGGETWATDTFLSLTSLGDTFVGVVPLASPPATPGWPRHAIDPLMVALLPSPRHAVILGRMFPLAPRRCSWLLLLPDPDITTWLLPLTLPLDTRVTVATLPPEDSTTPLWHVYQVTPAMEKRTLPAGRWIPPTLLDDSHLDAFRKEVPATERVEERRVTYGRMVAVVGDPLLRRTDLTGLRLACTTVNESPHTILTTHSNGTFSVTGIFGGVVSSLQEITNFTCSCRPSRDGQWGSLKDGRWTGMVGDVVDGVADMAVASLDITPERSVAVDFLLPISHTRYKMVVKRPSNSDLMWGTYIKEFSGHVWAVLGSTAVALMLAMHGTTAIMEQGTERLSLLESFSVVMGALCGQGCSTPPRTAPARLVLLTTLVLHVVVQAHYTSNLASSLAVGPLMPSFSTIRGVLAEPGLSFGLMRETAMVEYLKSSSDQYHQAAYSKLMARDSLMVGTSAEGVSKTLQEKYVYMDTDLFIYSNIDCRHYVLPGSEFRAFTSIAFKKGSPLVPILNSILLKMKGGGLIKKIQMSWVPRPEKCDQNTTSPIRLAAITAPLVGLLLAIILSLCCCSLEHSIIPKVSQRSHGPMSTLGCRDTAKPPKTGHGNSRTWQEVVKNYLNLPKRGGLERETVMPSNRILKYVLRN